MSAPGRALRPCVGRRGAAPRCGRLGSPRWFRAATAVSASTHTEGGPSRRKKATATATATAAAAAAAAARAAAAHSHLRPSRISMVLARKKWQVSSSLPRSRTPSCCSTCCSSSSPPHAVSLWKSSPPGLHEWPFSSYSWPLGGRCCTSLKGPKLAVYECPNGPSRHGRQKLMLRTLLCAPARPSARGAARRRVPTMGVTPQPWQVKPSWRTPPPSAGRGRVARGGAEAASLDGGARRRKPSMLTRGVKCYSDSKLDPEPPPAASTNLWITRPQHLQAADASSPSCTVHAWPVHSDGAPGRSRFCHIMKYCYPDLLSCRFNNSHPESLI
jgi:hypothetical protein